jgi:predicted dehydrogenase
MIKVGIAGFGKIGRIRAQEIEKHPDMEIVAIFDTNEALKDEHNYYHCNSYEKLLERSIDAVFVCAYNDVAVSYTIAALNANKHVFCEKPPARTIEELEEVIAVYEKSNLVLKYGFNHRYHYSVMEAKKKIDSGKYGKMLLMRGVYGKAGSIDYHKNWRNFKHISGGGILIDQGIHMLDLMLYFANDDFDTVQSMVTTAFWDIEAEDNAFINMRSKHGILASMHSSATQWRHKFLLEMTLENGFVNLDGILSGTRSYAPEKLIVGKREFEDITFAMGKPREETTWFENDNSWQYEVEEFANAVDGKVKVQNGTIYDAYNVLKLVETIYKSSL